LRCCCGALLAVAWPFPGVFLGAKLPFVVFPVLSGSLLPVLLAWAFSRWLRGALPYLHHWL